MQQVQWTVLEVPAAKLEHALNEFENARTPEGELLNGVSGPPIITYIDVTRVLVAWRCWARQ
jgi:hypothetical protein